MPTNFLPVDNKARRIISEDLDATLFVEASAGTGKTTSLVQRVVNLVSTGRTTLDRIAAITFTEAAAAELRDRIRARLERASADTELSDEERDRCARGIVDLDQADISTLHSFAGGILRERPLEAGLPPAFETSDQIVTDLRFNERWNSWLDIHLDGETDLGPQLALALTFGLTPDNMKDIAAGFHANYGDLMGAAFPAVPSPASTAGADLAAAREELERLCQFSKIGAGDALYDHVQGKLAGTAPSVRNSGGVASLIPTAPASVADQAGKRAAGRLVGGSSYGRERLPRRSRVCSWSWTGKLSRRFKVCGTPA